MKELLRKAVKRLDRYLSVNRRRMKGKPHLKGTDVTVAELLRLGLNGEAIQTFLSRRGVRDAAERAELAVAIAHARDALVGFLDRPWAEPKRARPGQGRPPTRVFDWDLAARLLAAGPVEQAWAGFLEDWDGTAVKIWDGWCPVRVSPKSAWPRVQSREWDPYLYLGKVGMGKKVKCGKLYKEDKSWGGCWYWPRRALDVIEGKLDGSESTVHGQNRGLLAAEGDYQTQDEEE